MNLVIVDTGLLVAAANDREQLHPPAVALLRRTDLFFVVPLLCIAEAAHLIARDLGPQAEAEFIAASAQLDLRAPNGVDLARMAELMLQYADFPIGAVDASIVALSERLGTEFVATFDRRHFLAIRPRHVEAFTLLPEL